MAESIFLQNAVDAISQQNWRGCGDISRFYLVQSFTRIEPDDIPEDKRHIYIELFYNLLIGVRGGGNNELALKVGAFLKRLIETTVNIKLDLRSNCIATLRKEGFEVSPKIIGYMFFWGQYSIPNFGDIIGEYFFRKITGMKYAGTYLGDGRGVIQSVGSLLTDNNYKAINWGPGIMHYFKNIEKDQLTFAVRGPYTIRRMNELDVISKRSVMFSTDPDIINNFDIPMGDPGLLLPKFYNPDVKITHKLGLIPHYDDRSDLLRFIADSFNCVYAEIPSILDRHGVKIINIQQHVETFIDELLTCENIVSSSLHGVIAAVAYKIPTRWMRIGNNLYGDDVKFFDFFMSLLWSPEEKDKGEYRRLVDLVHRARIDHNYHQELNEDPKHGLLKYNYPIIFTDNFDDIISQCHIFSFSEKLTENLWDACPYDSTGWKDKYLDRITEYIYR